MTDKMENGDRVARMADAIQPIIGAPKLKFVHFLPHPWLGESGRTQTERQDKKENTVFHGVPP